MPDTVRDSTPRPWFAICWLTVWGLFQAFAVLSILNGTWERPPAFPSGVYEALIYPDLVFVPLYLGSAWLMYRRHRLGPPLALVACGGIVYVMIYLVALSHLAGAVNLVADVVFLAFAVASVWQVCRNTRVRSQKAGLIS
jgi:hypothetical protein